MCAVYSVFYTGASRLVSNLSVILSHAFSFLYLLPATCFWRLVRGDRHALSASVGLAQPWEWEQRVVRRYLVLRRYLLRVLPLRLLLVWTVAPAYPLAPSRVLQYSVFVQVSAQYRS